MKTIAQTACGVCASIKPGVSDSVTQVMHRKRIQPAFRRATVLGEPKQITMKQPVNPFEAQFLRRAIARFTGSRYILFHYLLGLTAPGFMLAPASAG